MVRELERESRIVSFRLTIPDEPGVVETCDAAHAEEIFQALTADGYQPVRVEAGAVME